MGASLSPLRDLPSLGASSRSLILLGCVSALACGGPSTADTDGDGFSPADGDCDDLEAEVYPGGEETCDSLDNNCDGVVDEGFDADDDGFVACAPSSSSLLSRADCDDNDPGVNPEATEIWGDDIDQDCDGISTADAFVSLTCDGCPSDIPVFTTIQEAIDSAEDGQVIAVDNGDWAGGLSFGGKNLKLIAMGGNSLVTLKAPTTGATVLFNQGEGSGAWVKDFAIEGGPGEALGSCGHDGDLTHGGAVCIQGASPTLIGNIIREGRAGYGGGVYLGDSTAIIEGGDIRFNRGSFGGGVYSYESSPDLRKVRIGQNTASADGGGFYALGGRPRIRSALVESNTANKGGGLFFFKSDAYVKSSRVLENQASGRGGGSYLFESDVRFDHVLIEDNEASEGGGGFFYRSDATLSNVIFKENIATQSGGGLYLYLASNSDISHTTFVSNASPTAGGLIVDASNPELSMNLFAFNLAEEGNNLLSQGSVAVLSYNLFTAGQLGGDPYNTFDEDNATEAQAGLVGLNFGTGDITGSPDFANGPDDGDSDDDDYRLSILSPGIDAGVPGDEELYDPDGTRPDIGAFGGPSADGWDLDGDGSMAPWSPSFNAITDVVDCNDLDATLYPGQGC